MHRPGIRSGLAEWAKMARKLAQPAAEHLPLIAELARRAPLPLAVLSPRSRVLFVNDAFAALTGREPSHLSGRLASTLFSRALLAALKQESGVPQIWNARDGVACHVVRIPLESGYGIAVIGPATELPAETTVLKIFALLDELESGSNPQALRAIRSLLQPAAQATNRTPLAELVKTLLAERAQRMSGLCINVNMQLGPSPRLANPGAHSVLGAILDHATLELSLRPEPRLLRIGSAIETEGVLLLRLIHNGVQQLAPRLEEEARRHGLRLRAMSPGPGLGVTYVVVFPAE